MKTYLDCSPCLLRQAKCNEIVRYMGIAEGDMVLKQQEMNSSNT